MSPPTSSSSQITYLNSYIFYLNILQQPQNQHNYHQNNFWNISPKNNQVFIIKTHTQLTLYVCKLSTTQLKTASLPTAIVWFCIGSPNFGMSRINFFCRAYTNSSNFHLKKYFISYCIACQCVVHGRLLCFANDFQKRGTEKEEKRK